MYDFSAVEGLEGAVGFFKEEGAIVLDATGDARKGGVALFDGNGLVAFAVAVGEFGCEGGKAVFGPGGIEGFEGFEEGGKELEAVELEGLEGGSTVGNGFRNGAGVDANANDDAFEAFGGGVAFAKDAADFLFVNEDVVGPFEAGREAKGAEGLGNGDARNEGNGGRNVGWTGGANEEGEEEGLAGKGEPFAAKASAAGGLGFGEDGGALPYSGFGSFEEEVVGAGAGVEEGAAAAKGVGAEEGAEGAFFEPEEKGCVGGREVELPEVVGF